MMSLFLIPVIILVIYLIYEYWPCSPAALYEKRFRELRDDMRRRGLSPQQMHEEMIFRNAMARLRRRASDAALKAPSSARERLRELATEEGALIRDRNVRRRFLEIAINGPISDILYPEAMKVVDQHDRRVIGKIKPTADDIAAVTTRR